MVKRKTIVGGGRGSAATPQVEALGLAPGDGGCPSLSASATSSKAACKYWGSEAGCRYGDDCRFSHSWDGLPKQNRCFLCSGEGRVKKGCPHGKGKSNEAGNPRNPKRVRKMKANGGVNGHPARVAEELKLGSSR